MRKEKIDRKSAAKTNQIRMEVAIAQIDLFD